jgi:hypothetical protein
MFTPVTTWRIVAGQVDNNKGNKATHPLCSVDVTLCEPVLRCAVLCAGVWWDSAALPDSKEG